MKVILLYSFWIIWVHKMSDYILNEKGKENKEAPHKLILQIKGVHMKAILSLHIWIKSFSKQFIWTNVLHTWKNESSNIQFKDIRIIGYILLQGNKNVGGFYSDKMNMANLYASILRTSPNLFTWRFMLCFVWIYHESPHFFQHKLDANLS